MEPEIVAPPQPVIEPAPPTSQPKFSPKQPPKLLYILGGVAVILFSIALGIVFFGNKNGTTPATSNIPSTGSTTVDTTTWPKYTNTPYFYELSVPPSWTQVKFSPKSDDTIMFTIKDTANVQILAEKVMGTLDEYLASQDEASKNVIKAVSTTQVKVGAYDGYERAESWPTIGLQGYATYVKISDMVYSFILTPDGNKNAVTNESVLRDYRAALSSFRLTDTSKLGLDLKEYVSKKVEGLAFSAFSLKYSQTWALSEDVGENSLDVSIYRNNYELTISQKAVGGAVCLFSDSPAFEGSSGDLRNKQFAEFNTAGGSILRRYFNVNAGEKSTMFFCEKQKDGPYFQTPLTIGGLVYNVPAKYDADIIKEMDEIVKSITVIVATPSATP